MPPPIKSLTKKVNAVQLNLEELLKLLGTDPERFWEIVKGLTTPREGILVANELDSLAASVARVSVGVKALKATAKQAAV